MTQTQNVVTDPCAMLHGMADFLDQGGEQQYAAFVREAADKLGCPQVKGQGAYWRRKLEIACAQQP